MTSNRALNGSLRLVLGAVAVAVTIGVASPARAQLIPRLQGKDLKIQFFGTATGGEQVRFLVVPVTGANDPLAGGTIVGTHVTSQPGFVAQSVATFGAGPVACTSTLAASVQSQLGNGWAAFCGKSSPTITFFDSLSFYHLGPLGTFNGLPVVGYEVWVEVDDPLGRYFLPIIVQRFPNFPNLIPNNFEIIVDAFSIITTINNVTTSLTMQVVSVSKFKFSVPAMSPTGALIVAVLLAATGYFMLRRKRGSFGRMA